MRFLIIIALVLTMNQAFAQKKAYNKGLKLEAAGNISGAIEQYKNALYKNMSYGKAREALERTTTKRVDQLLQDHFIATEGNLQTTKESVNSANRIIELIEEMKYFSIDIDLPKYQVANLSKDRRLLSGQKISEANALIVAQKYDEAKSLVDSILISNPAHSQALEIQKEIKLALLEKEAKFAFDRKKYLMAFDAYQQLSELNPDNSEYRKQLEAIESRGRYAIAIVDVSEVYENISSSLKSSVIAEISGWKHPMLELMERGDLDLLIEEQKQSLSSLFDETSIPVPGNLKGIKNMLLMKVEDFSTDRNSDVAVQKVAYRQIKERTYNNNGDWRDRKDYQPVTYQEMTSRLVVSATVQYKVLEVETGRVLYAGKIRDLAKDEQVVPQFEGNPNELFPVESGRIIISGDKLTQYRSSFVKQGQLKSVAMLLKELESKIAAKVANDIRQNL
ncbi:MAG: hypothetical protein AAFQ94_05435 [Bacteroidota bacterium]